jgi:predicted DsbA family dithiol-disulfide isomerase
MKHEYELEIEWLGYELHPETAPEGEPLRKAYPELNPEALAANLNQTGAPYGIEFKPLETIVNSRLALEAAEFARDAGKFEDADDRLFRAYFQQGLNISEKDVVLRLLGEIGLNEDSLSIALDAHTYGARLEQAHEKAQANKIIALPTYIFNGKEKVVGAQPYSAFTRCLNAQL